MLYKKTSINLQIVGGFVMLCIFVNINQLYELVPKEYSGGIAVVFMIGLSKYFDLILGNNNAIIFNTKYYRMVLYLGLMLGVFDHCFKHDFYSDFWNFWFCFCYFIVYYFI